MVIGGVSRYFSVFRENAKAGCTYDHGIYRRQGCATMLRRGGEGKGSQSVTTMTKTKATELIQVSLLLAARPENCVAPMLKTH